MSSSRLRSLVKPSCLIVLFIAWGRPSRTGLLLVKLRERLTEANVTPLAETERGTRLRPFWIAIVAGLVLLTPEAHAQPSPQWGSCTGKPDVDWDQQIRSCSTLIESGRET